MYKIHELNEKIDFKQAIQKDMERKELSEAGLGKVMGISQQAVHKWIDRGFPPMSRLNDLKEILGAGSEVARMTHEQLYGDRVTRTPKLPTAPDAAYAATTRHPIPKAAAIKDFHERESAGFKATLPTTLSHNLEVAFCKGHGSTARIDYASDVLVVELVHASGVYWNQSWSAAMLRLMLCRDVARPNAKAVFLLVSENDAKIPRLVAAAAAQYGVELVQVASGEAAARYIADAEGEDIAEPDADE